MNFSLTCMASQELQVRYRQLTCDCPSKTKSTGRHCCLWCLVTSDELKSPPNSVACRSVAGILADFSNFQTAGGDLKRAKEFSNCVRETFFKGIPLTQVRFTTILISL